MKGDAGIAKNFGRPIKIYVYAIAKNEEQFVPRWFKSMSEADDIFVLDTGSSDKTVEKLLDLGCHVVKTQISPWRFDVARNMSLQLIPSDADVLVCTDLDEVLRKGWRKEIEEKWRPGTTTGRYEYVWSFEPDGSDGVKFFYEKIHAPNVCYWARPVHEVIEYYVPKTYCDLQLRLEHHPDESKSRSDYLRLLEIGATEAPEDSRSAHYLGREYMFRQRWDDAISVFERYLKMPTANWANEISATKRYLAKCWIEKGDTKRAKDYLIQASIATPWQKECFVDLGMLSYKEEKWEECSEYMKKAISIIDRDMSYASEAEAWGSLPWDVMSIAEWHLGRIASARDCAARALALNPSDERIRSNLAFFDELIIRMEQS